jgi:hypothetical protein
MQRLFVRRVHGWLERGFSRHGIGRVKEAAVLLEQELVQGIPAPTRSVVTVRYSRGFGLILNTSERVTVTYAYRTPPETVTPSP